MVAFRDPNGIRPLVKGVRTNNGGDKEYIIASENTMFYPLGFEPEGSVLPGELIYINQNGKVFKKRITKQKFNPCIFEYCADVKRLWRNRGLFCGCLPPGNLTVLLWG